jgi:hypothetical protein
MLMLIFRPVQPYRLGLIFLDFSDLNDAFFSQWEHPNFRTLFFILYFTLFTTLHEHHIYMDAVLFTLSLRYARNLGLKFTFTCLASRYGADLKPQCLLFTDELPIPENICPPNDCQLTSWGPEEHVL